MKKVSIVLPVYNMEVYLERCLNSLINQTYKNLEIILVNDGSKDNSFAICSNFSKIDNRIIVIDKENGGVSSARNTGLNYVTGDYVMFVDPDDWIDLNVIEVCLKKFDEIDDLDVAMFPYIKEFNKTSVKVKVFDNDTVFIDSDAKSKVFSRFFGVSNDLLKNPEKNDQFSAPWGKLIKTELLTGLEFVDIKYIGAEDTWFNVQLFNRINVVCYVGNVHYHYNKANDNSITKSFNEQLLWRRKNLYNCLKDFVKNNRLDKSYYQLIDNRIVFEIFIISMNIINSNLSLYSKYKKIKFLLRDDIYKFPLKRLDLKLYSLKWKIFFILAKFKMACGILILTYIGRELRKINF